MKFDWKSRRLDWGFFDMLLIIGACAAGIGIWFIPSWSNTEGFQKLEKAVHERVDLANRIKAKEAEIKKKNEEEGIVYFGPGGVPQPEQPFRGKSPDGPASQPPASPR
jgi:hypothetical protein